MNFDLVFVTYNSEKWIDNCFESIKNVDYNLNNLNIFVVDNKSTDGTKDKLYRIKNKINVGSFEIIEAPCNLGFGRANNLGFNNGKSDIVCFINIDTEMTKDLFIKLEEEVNSSSSEVALWEFRQFPYEHPKMYNPITRLTTWSSGAAFAIKREVFEKIKGFDDNIFMYAEDVDLSWRLRIEGYTIKYAPRVVIYHYCYKEANEVKPNQYFNSVINNIMLRYKFGSNRDILKGYSLLLKLLMHRGPFIHSRKILIKKLMFQHLKLLPYVKWRFSHRKILKNFNPKFCDWDYEIIRDGAFYFNEFPAETPLVSVVVRTCGRPTILKETLISLRNQTYNNIEILVVEDGKNISEEMINKEFSDLNIIYRCSGIKIGRSKVGNIGLELSKGKYINFLDDDDVFFADHIEVLLSQLVKNKDYRAAYSLAYETPIIVESREPYIYKEIYHNLIYKQPFNKLLLFHHNYLPIQSIMFEKSIFLERGGFDEKIDYLEDWDLWVRYALNNNFLFIQKVTSMYRVPFDKTISKERQELLDSTLEQLKIKHKEYKPQISVAEVSSELQTILDSYIIKISPEVFAKVESRRLLVGRMLLKFKNILKRIF